MKLFGDLRGILFSRLLKKPVTAAAAGSTVVLVWMVVVEMVVVEMGGAFGFGSDEFGDDRIRGMMMRRKRRKSSGSRRSRRSKHSFIYNVI